MEDKKFDERHGGPHDRGSADAWYARAFSPHYYEGGSYTSERRTDLTPEEIVAYKHGYDTGEWGGKDYGEF